MAQTKQLKITAEIDGKQVPLENISTETFEAIKTLEKPKEIPVARVGNYIGYLNNRRLFLNNRRLFLKISPQLREVITQQKSVKVVAIELDKGRIKNTWVNINTDLSKLYENIEPL